MTRAWTWRVLVFSTFWVFYVTLFSETILYFDSFGYEQLAQKIAHGPILDYFRDLNREPLYPLFLALNMKLADILHIPYTNLVLLTQGIILLAAQWLMALVLETIGLSDKITALLVLYFVISPSVLRSSLIVYSEIITYPLMIAAVLVSCKTWDFLMGNKSPWRFYAQRGLYTGLVFVPLIFVKGIFELITPVFLFVLGVAAAIKWKMDRQAIKIAAVFLIAALTAFWTPVLMYKTVNKIYNGHFAFTNRGSWALYGTAARRALPVTPQEHLAQMLYVFPDKSWCERAASPAACAHWHYQLSDNLGMQEYQQLRAQNLSNAEIDRQLMTMSLKVMVTHPWATLQGMFWEGAKLIFWEYPAWGMVALPKELHLAYQAPMTYYSVLIIINLLNFISVCWAVFYLLFRRPFQNQPAGTYMAITMILLFLYIAAHSLFFLNERNALPIVPLFFILAGAGIKVFKKENK